MNQPRLSVRERTFLAALMNGAFNHRTPREVIVSRHYNRDWAMLTLGLFWGYRLYNPGPAFDGVHYDGTHGGDLGLLTPAGRKMAMEIILARGTDLSTEEP